jgi:hypothetical protein
VRERELVAVAAAAATAAAAAAAAALTVPIELHRCTSDLRHRFEVEPLPAFINANGR